MLKLSPKNCLQTDGGAATLISGRSSIVPKEFDSLAGRNKKRGRRPANRV